MGSKYQQEDSTNSSDEESDQVQEMQQNSGIIRSYECVFCKRGFTTAQALGGHMNIHRKDKAKTRPSKENKLEKSSYGCKAPTIFPVSTSSCSSGDNHQDQLRVMEEYRLGLSLSLSLRFGTSKFSEEVENKRRVGLIEDDDLDLELRLGHNP